MTGEDPWLLITACAAATYLTRIGGHLLMSRFGALHFRVQAAFDAVPYAVLAALIAPAAVSRGPAEVLALGIAAFAALRLKMTSTVVIGLVATVALRWLLG